MSPATFQDFSDTPLPLIAGQLPFDSEKIILLSGESARTRGAVLGRVAGAVTPTAWAGNTGGSGTIASATVGAGVKEGTYRLICVEPAANAGAFMVEDPDGNIVGRATVAVAFTGPVNFTITDATDFVVGDGFDIVVAKGTKYKLAASAATDGSAIPRVVLAENADAALGDVEALAYTRGDINSAALVIGVGHTVASIKADLLKHGINLITPIL